MRNHPERALAACAPPHTRGPDTSRVAPLSLAWVRHFARGSDGMRVGSMVCAWATPTRISRGWRACHGVNAHCQRFASGTPGQAPLRPQRRPPCPRHPIVGVCYRGGLRLGRHAAPRRDLTDSKRGNCTIRGTTRRRETPNAAKPPIQPWVRMGRRGELRPGVARITEHLGHHAHASHCSSRWSATWAPHTREQRPHHPEPRPHRHQTGSSELSVGDRVLVGGCG